VQPGSTGSLYAGRQSQPLVHAPLEGRRRLFAARFPFKRKNDMSLVGIDVGSSSVKVAACAEDGTLIGSASHNLTPLHPAPGLWETDPEDIWQATCRGMRELAAQDAVQHDPPQAIAVSASGRENFPADALGNPLGNGIMGADVRGAEFEVPPPGSPIPEDWCLSCGHLRERMDPVFRLEWWRKYQPEIIANTTYFFGWIDFLTFRMCGRAVMDQSTVSRYLAYDLERLAWAPERVAEYHLTPNLLPEVLPWGALIGELKPEVAADWGLPAGVQVAQGCHDLNCAAYGAGVYEIGTACLVSGSYENILIPTDRLPTASMLLGGLSVMPQPCEAGRSVIAVHPTGNAVLNWARDLTGVSIETVEQELQRREAGPAPVLAVPYLSGSMTYWENGRKARGGLIGLTLATSQTDIVQAFMESIAYDTVNTLSLMRAQGIHVDRIRITGGGARSTWWTQLKADLTNLPVEVVAHPEPGTLGAALLAGLAIGTYNDLEGISKKYSGTQAVYTPNPERAARHQERLETYRKLMGLLLAEIY
jgi:xylulokinase